MIVLGGGSAGTAAASAAVAEGARVALINDGELGGLCILRGCMPTKSMLEAAHALHETTRLGRFGIDLHGEARPDVARILARKDAHVARFKRAKIESIERGGYEVIDARARFNDDGSVSAGKRRLTAKGYVIATGSVPTILPIEGIEQVPVWSSDDVMRLSEAPRRLLVLGAGAIGLELAQFFARVGTEVLLVNRSSLLAKHDPACGLALTDTLRSEPRLDIVAPGRIERLEPDGDGLVATICDPGADPRRFAADALLMATGRHPAVAGLGLDAIGLAVEGGRIVHDDEMRTARDDVWIAGDTTGNFQILHLANQEGRVAGANAAGASPARKIDYRLKMSVIFTDPPFAEVGLSEIEAGVLQRPVIVGEALLPSTGRAITMEVRTGAWKIVADPESGEILGASVLGPRADDLIHQIALLMYYRGTVADILAQPWYHPTLSEVILNVARDLADQLP